MRRTTGEVRIVNGWDARAWFAGLCMRFDGGGFICSHF